MGSESRSKLAYHEGGASPIINPITSPKNSAIVPSDTFGSCISSSEKDLAIYMCPSAPRQDTGIGDYGGIVGTRALPAKDGMRRIPTGWEFGHSYADGVLVATNSTSLNAGIRRNKPIRAAQVRDGLSNTMMVAEDSGRTVGQNGRWADGNQTYAQHNPRINYSRSNEIFSDHPSGACILLSDSSVQYLYETVDREIIDALATRERGEIIPGDVF